MNNQNIFLQKFQGQVETVGKEGLLAVLKNVHHNVNDYRIKPIKNNKKLRSFEKPKLKKNNSTDIHIENEKRNINLNQVSVSVKPKYVKKDKNNSIISRNKNDRISIKHPNRYEIEEEQGTKGRQNNKTEQKIKDIKKSFEKPVKVFEPKGKKNGSNEANVIKVNNRYKNKNLDMITEKNNEKQSRKINSIQNNKTTLPKINYLSSSSKKISQINEQMSERIKGKKFAFTPDNKHNNNSIKLMNKKEDLPMDKPNKAQLVPNKITINTKTPVNLPKIKESIQLKKKNEHDSLTKKMLIKNNLQNQYNNILNNINKDFKLLDSIKSKLKKFSENNKNYIETNEDKQNKEGSKPLQNINGYENIMIYHNNNNINVKNQNIKKIIQNQDVNVKRKEKNNIYSSYTNEVNEPNINNKINYNNEYSEDAKRHTSIDNINYSKFLNKLSTVDEEDEENNNYITDIKSNAAFGKERKLNSLEILMRQRLNYRNQLEKLKAKKE